MRAAIKNQAELIAVSYAEPVDLTYRSDEEIEKAYLQYVSGWMFSTLGIKPALGRVFTENDDLNPGGHPYAVLSQLLDAPLWPGRQRDRPHFSDRQRPL
jgi:hypothetical protein